MTRWLCLLASVLFLPGCGSSTWLLNGFLDPAQQGNFMKPVNMEIRGNMSLLEEPLGIQDAEEPSQEDTEVVYEEPVIAPGDVVRISIFELVIPGQITEQQIQVTNSGYETLQVLGPTKIAGFTSRELELDLVEKLRTAGILEEAEVQVSILRSEAAQYTVIGQVRQPGNYPLPRPGYRLLNAIGAVGGIPDNIEKIYVFREGARSDGEVMQEAGGTSPDGDQVPFTMSDVSNGPSSSQPSPMTIIPAAPPGEGTGIDELEILEGRPQGERMLPEYDPATGEWRMRRADSQPMAPVQRTREEPPRVMEPAMEEVRVPPTAPARDAMEAQPDEALEPAVRVIEIPTKLLLAGDPRYNIVIRPRDLINVPAGVLGEYYLFGNVARPGAYSLTGRQITVKQALAAGGGFNPLAMPSRADLVRRVSQDEEQTIQIDLDAIFAGKAPDFYLRPNDIINVGSSPINYFLAVMRNAFRMTYGFGFVYDRNFADSDTFQAREQVRNRRRLEAQARGLPF